jgi:hypothetical protein
MFGRRLVRRMARRTVRRLFRRRFLLTGGMVALAVGGTLAAIKLSQHDVARVEQATGQPVERLSDEELAAALKRLGIQPQSLSPHEQATVASAESPVPAGAPASTATTPASTASALDELEKLGALHGRGIITDEEFAAKKRQLLGL